MLAIFWVTMPYSSRPPSCSAMASASPAVTLSRLRLMRSNGPSARCDSPAASTSENKIAVPEISILDPFENRSVGNALADEIRIGVENCVAFGVDDCSVIDHGPTAHDGFKKVVQIAVGSKVISDRSANRLRVARVNARTAQIR